MNGVKEVNFDGLVGPTHSYAGLSLGNVASTSHRGQVSHPRAAALEGLAKMAFMAELGVPQALLPPHPRPSLATLRALGFHGDDAQVLRRAAREAPDLLQACSSSSSMWVANAATVTPSRDSADGRVHFTPANLVAKLHRSIEPPQTAAILRAVFSDPRRFQVHEPIPSAQGMGDEGAANHTRLCVHHGGPGLHLYVFGHDPRSPDGARLPRTFPARQSITASAAVARAHGVRPAAVWLAQQSPRAIDAGVFHHDVIGVGNENLLFLHEDAFVDTPAILRQLRARFRALNAGQSLETILVRRTQVSLRDAVRSYLFNSQLVTLPSGGMALIAPAECREVPNVARFLERLLTETSSQIRQVHFVTLRESMRNGGGPACLRLRVVLTPQEWRSVAPVAAFTTERHAALVDWVKRHYRETLAPRDLADPALLEEGRRALDELTQMLKLGSLYPFQRETTAAGTGTR